MYTTYEGFSTRKQVPFAPPVAGEPRIGPFLDVGPGRLDAETPPRYLDPWGMPYAYFAFDQSINAYPAHSWKGVTAYRQNGKPLHSQGFQIISSGPNKVFGPGGEWSPGQGVWAPGGSGGDDLSNFNHGRLAQQSE
ncbi:MAG: hypothetical protein JWO38_7853 [Gemmataceae bacterium]|nr:hypothetical protein [Gemmataceae bacterium]